MEERIRALARALSGAREADGDLLEALCAAAEAFWKNRLPEHMTAEDCGPAFVCAAAYTAAAGLTAGRGGGVVSFTAGDLSVKGPGGGERLASAQALRQAAEELMASYVLPGDICLKGVQG